MRGTEPSTGSRIGPTIRVGNRPVRDISAQERLLEIVCADGGSRQQRRLVAVVTKAMALETVRTPHANVKPGVVYTPCRCGLDLAGETDEAREAVHRALRAAGLDPASVDLPPTQSRGHFLDVAKVLEAAERLRYQPRKARRIDAARVAPMPQ